MNPLEELHARVDEAAAKLAATHRDQLACRRGCFGCCVDDLSVFEIEADRIRRAMPEGMTPHPPGRCAFLDAEGACRVYEARPYVCRTQGLPLRWIDDEQEAEFRDICELNDVAVESIESDACWTIGPHEQELAEMQRDGKRVKLRDLF
jgi:Fe-S-cluster containining protein